MAHLDLSYILDNVSQDKGFINQLLQVFENSLEVDIPPLSEAINRADHEQIRKQSHKIKSGFRSLGMVDMTQYLQELEDMGKNRVEIETIQQKFDGFIDQVPAVKAEIAEHTAA